MQQIIVDRLFFNDEIIESKITLSTLHQCFIESCCIKDGDFHTSTFNGTKIINSVVNELDLSHLNLEFVMISGLSLEGKVVLPPYQIPYILNGIKYAINNTEKFKVYTDKGMRSGEYYINQLSLLQDYYKSRNELFPVANILLSKGLINDAINIIDEGIHASIDTKDFRMLKNYCWLLKESPDVSIGKKHDIYRKINTYVNSIPLTQSEYFSYTTYINMSYMELTIEIIINILTSVSIITAAVWYIFDRIKAN